MIQTFDNRSKKIGDDLKLTIKPNSELFISGNSFSIYGFEALKKEFKKIKSLKFIFTTNFVKNENDKRQRRKFSINSLKSLSGTQFEIDLKNKLNHSFLAKEAKKFLEKKATFKAPLQNHSITPMFIIKNDELVVYLNISEFSMAGFGYKKDNSLLNPITKFSDQNSCNTFLTQFQQVWNDANSLEDITKKVLEYIGTLYKENSPKFIYYLILYHLFDEFLEDLNEDELANEKTGFKNSVIWNKLYDFQKDAVLGLINRLEKYNGAILADSVGLGKTFSALAVIKYYQERNRSILVLTPKKLGLNWSTYTANYKDNPLIKDRFNYDVLYHTDLLRDRGYSNGIDLSRINWSNYDLIVIDESHNFRNNDARKDKKTRYKTLLDEIIKKGVKTKILMLSATPVNNRFNDLKNQIALIYEGKTDIVDEKLGISKSIDVILKDTQKVFNDWLKLPKEKKTSKELLNKLSKNFDFFKLLDNITIARSRKHIRNYYDMSQIGYFPKRLKPISKYTPLTSLSNFMGIEEIYNQLSKFTLALYSPFEYIMPGKKRYYEELYDTKIDENVYLKQSNREDSLKILMRVNFLKRLESSVYAFRLTLSRYIQSIENILSKIDKLQNIELSVEDEEFDENLVVGKKIQINLKDMDIYSWREDLKYDLNIAKKLLSEFEKITPKSDEKLNELKRVIKQKLNYPINPNNKKILIFSAFADTADYLYKSLKEFNKTLALNSAKIVGSDSNETTLNISKDFNNLLMHFSPKSKETDVENEIDILIATDCISEGQNLQDCDYLINYDIHWNPVRIIQRFGRIDRIGSKNSQIQMVNFWPELSLDEYINLKSRVEGRMHLVDVTATGEDNVLTNKSSDLEFRKEQLKKLQSEVVDLENIDSTISITDLGLNDFRIDLISFLKESGDLEDTSTGLHTVVLEDKAKNLKEGVIFVLKNINKNLQLNKQNQLHPFYLVYVTKDEVVYSYKDAKNILDLIRSFSKNQDKPIKKAYESFNKATHDGKDMSFYSTLLNKAINSILETNEESMIDSLFSSGGTVINKDEIKGLEDFELIAFIVIKAKDV